MLITNRSGYCLLGFERGDESHLLQTHSPVTASLVIVEHRGLFLLGFNRKRCQWEAPAGQIEFGETARDCATRELLEESGQITLSLRFVGLAEMIRPTGQRKYTAVYSTLLTKLCEFIENTEWSQVCWWDLASSIENIDNIDMEIMRCGVSAI